MKYAVVEAGGKQYRAEEGKTLLVDLLPVQTGEIVTLDKILLLVDGDDVQVGAPYLEGSSIQTKVLGHVKGKKILVFKYKPRIQYRRRAGHRQQYTRLLVEQIA
jgi:large subunit ribosomal protein L21